MPVVAPCPLGSSAETSLKAPSTLKACSPDSRNVLKDWMQNKQPGPVLAQSHRGCATLGVTLSL